MSSTAALLISLACLLAAAEARSGGAPSQACSNLTPQHSTNTPRTTAIPYSLDLSVFDDGAGGLQYTPSTTYTLTLMSNNGENFLGFFVRCFLASDGTTPAGVFATDAGNTRLSSCTPTNSGVTHSSAVDRMSVTMEWTAPAEGTGPVEFAFSVVQQFNTFWANERTAAISEIPPPTNPPTDPPTDPPTAPQPTAVVATATPVPTATPITMATEMTTDPTTAPNTDPTTDPTTEPTTRPTTEGGTTASSSEQPQSESPTASASGMVLSALSILVAVVAVMLL